MQIKSIAECSKEHSAILSIFIKLPFVFKTFFSSYFEWPLKTGFTVHRNLSSYSYYRSKKDNIKPTKAETSANNSEEHMETEVPLSNTTPAKQQTGRIFVHK